MSYLHTTFDSLNSIPKNSIRIFLLQEPSCDNSDNQIQNTLDGIDTEVHKKTGFPHLDPEIINQFIKEEAAHVEHFQVVTSEPKIVPCSTGSYSRQQHYIHSRKLEVLKDCVTYIFDNKISEARMVSFEM